VFDILQASTRLFKFLDRLLRRERARQLGAARGHHQGGDEARWRATSVGAARSTATSACPSKPSLAVHADKLARRVYVWQGASARAGRIVRHVAALHHSMTADDMITVVVSEPVNILSLMINAVHAREAHMADGRLRKQRALRRQVEVARLACVERKTREMFKGPAR
jgi:hypothetical protein